MKERTKHTKCMKHVMALGLAAVMSGSLLSMTACGGREDVGTTIDKTKTQLTVSVYEGGFGVEWFYDVKAKFEAAYASKSYEDGKTGIEIIPDTGKTLGREFSWQKTKAQVVVTEQMTTEMFLQMIAKGEVMKLDDVMTSILAQDGISLKQDILDVLKMYDGSIYQIPHYEGGGGIVYDKDVFNENNLYISSNGGWTNASGDLSVGADGIADTADDGLPATYKEFYNLCQTMTTRNITPFIIAGEAKAFYCDFIPVRASMTYNGREETSAFVEFDGTQATYITETTENADAFFGYDVQTATAEITPDNGYLVKQTPGALYGYEMLSHLLEKKWYDTKGWASTVSHLDAQELFLKSDKNGSPIAMLIDGTWWECEATDVFNRMSNNNPASPYSKSNRNFGWMAFPTKVDETDTNNSTDSLLTLDNMRAFMMVRAGISSGLETAAKDFLKFCYTPENMEAYTATTGTTRPFTYSISQETKNALTPFQQEIWWMHENEQFVYPNVSQFYVKNTAKVFTDEWQSPEYRSPITTFSTVGNTVTALQFYKSCWMSPEEWDKKVTK